MAGTSGKTFQEVQKIVEQTMSILTAKTLKLIEATHSSDSETGQEIKKFKANFSKYFELLCTVIFQLGITPEELLDANPLVAMSKQLLVSSRLHELTKWTKDIDSKISELNSLNEQIKEKTLESRRLSETDLNQIRDKIVFYQAKGESYRQQIKKAETELKNSGFVEGLNEKSIDELRQKNFKLKEDLEPLQDKLKSFDFEPNSESLLERISELQSELAKVNLMSDC